MVGPWENSCITKSARKIAAPFITRNRNKPLIFIGLRLPDRILQAAFQSTFFTLWPSMQDSARVTDADGLQISIVLGAVPYRNRLWGRPAKFDETGTVK